MRRLIIVSVVSLTMAFVGPHITGPRGRSAGAPFVYQPPDGMVIKKDAPTQPGTESRVWVLDEALNDGPVDQTKVSHQIRAILHHSTREMSVEERDLAKLAAEMPHAFEESCVWTHRRHELRTRADGARVGLIEGDCVYSVDFSSLGVPVQTLKSRKLQLMFPDDSGTSIVTASYPADQAARWEPVFEATIAKASGVATRVPSPPPWTYGAWSAAGIVLGWLLAAVVARRAAPPAPAASAEKAEKAEKADDESTA